MKFGRMMARLLVLTVLVVATAGATESPDMSPPSAPTNIRAWWVEPEHVYLKWDAAQDDIGVSTYRLYRNDELVATTFKTYFLDMEYEREVYNFYFVTAVDAAGNESAPSEVIGSPAN